MRFPLTLQPINRIGQNANKKCQRIKITTITGYCSNSVMFNNYDNYACIKRPYNTCAHANNYYIQLAPNLPIFCMGDVSRQIKLIITSKLDLGLNFYDDFFVRSWACWIGNQSRIMNM